MKSITTLTATALALVTLCLATHGQFYSESDWHMAFNNKVARGEVEVWHATGRIDILTDEYAIEVDHVRNYFAGIKQALQYAAATKRKPGLALFIDGSEDTTQALDAARKLCAESDVRFWLINEYVSVNELVSQKNSSATLTPGSAPGGAHGSVGAGEDSAAVERTHWLSAGGVRHNRSCRWFGNTRKGRFCRPDEGRSCRQCGG